MKGTRRVGLGRGLGALIPSLGSHTIVEEKSPSVASKPSAIEVSEFPEPKGTRRKSTVAKKATGSRRRTAAPAVEPDAASEMDLSPVPGAQFRELPITSIVPNAKQPRQVFDEEALDELQTSIREVGLLQPIVVRSVGDDTYELIMGERRWRSAQAVGLTTIPAIIRDTSDDAMLRDALMENIHRANLNPLEEGAAYQQLLEEFDVTHQELSKRIGRSRPQITNTIRLLNLPPAVQRRVAAGVLSAGHARALLSLEESEAQEALAQRIVAEGLSVRVTEEIVSLREVEAGKPPVMRRRAKPHAPALHDLAEKLCDRFDTKVKVDLGRRKGKITIEFATVDDLERIVSIIGFD
ncbi:MAG: ParB/RepB/Spo0J family partition protein [Longispora sp.]|nr:ParB/RepB/Spo0J family partition protein [Longispora sp. (in: high G+C Gram-positive bacteria)]